MFSKSGKSLKFGIIRLRIYVQAGLRSQRGWVGQTERTTVYFKGRLYAVVLAAFLALGIHDAPRSADVVRVRLFSGKTVTSLNVADANGDRLTIHDPSGALATLDMGQKLEFDVWNDFLRAKWTSGSVPLDHAFITPRSGAATLTVDGESRSYRGTIEIILDGEIEKAGLVVINEVGLSDYVSSVLPKEYGFKEPEGLKAQAIVIRTYALRAKSEGRKPYDLTDGTGSQVYDGLEAETEFSRAAVEATAGVAITHDGHLIEAVYSAHCGGHSASNEDVWNSRPVPYLRGRKDPYDGDAPVARWESRIRKDDLLQMLSQAHGVRVKSVSVSKRGTGDRATEIKLDADPRDVDVSTQSFRVAVNGRFGGSAIKSTHFDVRSDGDSYRFSGRGLGHGVGLCQWGAAAMAKNGRSYEDILHFYYKDVKIEGHTSDAPFASMNLTAVEKADSNPARKPAASAEEPSETKPPATTRRRSTQRSTSGKSSGRRIGW